MVYASPTCPSGGGEDLVLYWGQNSYGASHPADKANYEGRLRDYCTEPIAASTIVLSFLHVFHGNPPNLPEVNFANHCEVNSTFSGTALLHCPEIGEDIKFCQSKGVHITLGLGGAAGSYGFQSEAEGEAFAQTIWDLFLGGTSNYRPFDDARLNGINLDIEGGSQTGYVRFVQSIQNIAKSKDPLNHYSVTAAPQCPMPDAYMAQILEQAFLDAVYIQFYNNYCGVNAYPSTNFNWDAWASWASTASINPKVRLYLGIPASPTAASIGYMEAPTIGQIIKDIRSRSPSSFSGVMMWDASQAYANQRYGNVIHDQYLMSSCSPGNGDPKEPPKLPSSTSTASTSPTSSSPTPTSSSPTSPTSIQLPKSPSSTAQPIPSSSSKTGEVPPAPTTSKLPAPPPNSPGTGTCPRQGASCGASTYACAGPLFAQCAFGSWVLRPCQAGTVCYSMVNPSSVYCGIPDPSKSLTSCSIEGSERRFASTTPALLPDQDQSPVVQVIPLTHNSSHLLTLLRAHAGSRPIESNWSVQLDIPQGQKIVQSDRGTILRDNGRGELGSSGTGNEPNQSMAIDISLWLTREKSAWSNPGIWMYVPGNASISW